MQRKGNAIHRESQVKNQISVGIDMGGSLWATAVHDWEAGKMSYYGLKDKVDRSKEDRVFDLVSNLHKSGKRIDVFYEAGRYGYWPARKLMALGAHVHILPINKLQVIMSGKTIKTDKLDAKFLAGLHPSDHVPTVYIPTLEEEGRRDAEREWNRIKESIGRVNAQMIALIERTPLPGKIKQTFQELADIHMMKEALRSIYAVAQNASQAEDALLRWVKAALQIQSDQLHKMAKTILQHWDGILGFWHFGNLTNAAMEGFNNKVRTMLRQAYGYRDLEYMRLKIFNLPENNIKIII